MYKSNFGRTNNFDDETQYYRVRPLFLQSNFKRIVSELRQFLKQLYSINSKFITN